MKRLFMGGLALAAGWLAPRATAGEVIATATAPVPVASSRIVAEADHPTATLGRPRVVRGVSAEPQRLRRASFEAAPFADAPSLARPFVPPSPFADPEAPSIEGAGAGSFAVERVAYFAPADEVKTPATLPAPEAIGGIPPESLHGPSVMPAGVLPANPAADDLRRLYATAEYLLWWTKDAPVPPLVTTSLDPFDNGILGAPTTAMLFGGDLDHGTRHGARFRLGYWLDTCNPLAVEGSFFFLGERADRFAANSDQFPVLARPFFDLNNGVESAQLVASPGVSVGTLVIDAPSRLLGADLNLRREICCLQGCRGSLFVDLLGGFRYLNLDEGLHVTEVGVNLPTAPLAPGQSFRIDDLFDTSNRFYGGQLGLAAEWRRGRWFLDARGTLALGVTRQVATIQGNAIFVDPSGTVRTERGGLLALPSNSGRFSQDRFAVVPEVGFNVGYQLSDGLRVFGGYSFLYWSSVLRPGDQIDRVIDITQVPGDFAPPDTPPAGMIRPAVPLRESSYWAQGFNFGLELRY